MLRQSSFKGIFGPSDPFRLRGENSYNLGVEKTNNFIFTKVSHTTLYKNSMERTNEFGFWFEYISLYF